MTRAKIAITIPEELLVQVKDAVARGEASSVSAYISDAIAMRGARTGLRAYLNALIERDGEPTEEDYAWADEQMRRMGIKPPPRPGSRSTRVR